MRIRKSLSLVLAAAIVLSLWAVRVGHTQESQPGAEAAQESEQPKKKRRAPRGRLPNHYGKLGLSQEQKDKIYGIQRNYRARLRELQQQIDDLRQQETLEIQGSLTDNQRERLVGILKEAEERRAARRKARQARAQSESQ